MLDILSNVAPHTLCFAFEVLLLLTPRTCRKGITWAWAEVQDCEHGNTLRVTAYARQAKELVDVGFLLNVAVKSC